MSRVMVPVQLLNSVKSRNEASTALRNKKYRTQRNMLEEGNTVKRGGPEPHPTHRGGYIGRGFRTPLFKACVSRIF